MFLFVWDRRGKLGIGDLEVGLVFCLVFIFEKMGLFIFVLEGRCEVESDGCGIFVRLINGSRGRDIFEVLGGFVFLGKRVSEFSVFDKCFGFCDRVSC